MKYDCYGDVRGDCGVSHRSREAAERHCAQDQAGIRRAYPSTFPTRAYSDRYPRALDAEALAACASRQRYEEAEWDPRRHEQQQDADD